MTERDGTPVPGLTVTDVARQLTWRVLGPLKGRAKSVLDWAGLRGEPPKTLDEAGRTYFVTGRAVAYRVRRVAAEGARILRSKGILSFTGDDDRYVFQGVHMMLEGDHQRAWKDGEARESRLVFIGRELPEQIIRDGFESCITT